MENEEARIIDYSKCIVCQDTTPRIKLSQPTSDAYSNLLTQMGVRQSYGDSTYADSLAVLNSVSYTNLKDVLGGKWHTECYKNVTNKTKIERLKERFNKMNKPSDITSVLHAKVGRPSKESSSSENCNDTPTRPKREKFDKLMCWLCQEDVGVALHNVRSAEITSMLTEIAANHDDNRIKVRLSMLLTAKDDKLAGMTFDMKYHLKCLMTCYRKSTGTEKTVDTKMEQLLSDFEFVECLSRTLSNDDVIERCQLSMNDIQNVYFDILEDNQVPILPSKRYKPYLKELIRSNISNVNFVRPKDMTKPEYLITTGEVRRLLSNSLNTNESSDEFNTLMAAAKILRKEMLNSPEWKFEGTFENYSDPKLLLWFCNYLLHGPRKIKNVQKEDKSTKSASIVSQHIMQSVRTNRQMSHDSKEFRTYRETPFAVGNAIFARVRFRSKLLNEFLYDINSGISYDKVMDIENSVADHVYECMKKYGYYLPVSKTESKQFHWYALDNVDFLEDTPNGMNTTHATGIVQISSNNDNVSRISYPELKRPSSKNYVNQIQTIPMHQYKLSDPKPKKKLDIELKSKELDVDFKNFSWVLGCLNLDRLRENSIPGTWGAFNSLVSSKPPCKTSVVMIPPLIPQTPTDIGVLYSCLLYVKNISNQVNPAGMRTVVTFDMQLYDLAMRIWCNVNHIEKDFLFRPGELHIIFWALATVGDYIEGSGIDQAWVEAGLYSATTVSNQILKGKHLYRSLECNFVTTISIYTLFFKKYLKNFPEELDLVETLAMELQRAYKMDSDNDYETSEELYKTINEDAVFFEKIIGISNKLESFKNDFTSIQKFLMNYVKQFETILVFIRATRDRDIELHLDSLECLVKYVFAHDHLTYARLLPLYLATMQKARKDDPELWQEFKKGNFCVSKSNVKFTSIGPDHAIEQENRRLKVSGGIVGITQHEQALERFFLAAPVLSAISKDFESRFTKSRRPTTKHHDLDGTKPKRIKDNVQSLCRVIVEHGDPFESSDGRLFNILTHALVSEKVEEEILQRDQIGQKLFEEFVGRLDGSGSVWSEMKKRKIGSFKQTNKSTKVTAKDGKIVILKEERNLLQRFIIIARKRTDLDLELCIGQYEFGVVPRAFFSADGTILLEKQKYKVAALLRSGVVAAAAEAVTEDAVPESDTTIEEISNTTTTTTTTATEQAPSIEDISHTITTEQAPSIEGISNTITTEQAPSVATEDTPADTSNIVNSETRKAKVIILDGMAIVNGLPKDKNPPFPIITCKDLAELFLCQLRSKCDGYDEVRLVFDRYVSDSLKWLTREGRNKGVKSTQYRINDSTIIKGVKLKDLLSDINTKSDLTSYLAEKCLSQWIDTNFMVTFQTTTRGNTDVPENLVHHDHEEADTMILLHASTIEKDAKLDIYASDTDILLQLVHRYPNLPYDTYFLGKSDTVSIKDHHEYLGEKRAAAIIGFHAFTGCDVTGKFAGRSKEKCFKKFLEADDEILRALANLGATENLPGEEDLRNLERFVCFLYDSTKIDQVKNLRWYLYSRKQAQGENLPPTMGALLEHFKRAHYTAMVYMRNLISVQDLPLPENYGWKYNSDLGIYEPVLTQVSPAPAAIVDLVKCNCKQGCVKNCGCKKSTLPCTEICGCFDDDCRNPYNIATNVDTETPEEE